MMDRVVSNDSEVVSVTTVFAGTRVPLDILYEYKLEGLNLEEFLENYPSVERWNAETAWGGMMTAPAD